VILLDKFDTILYIPSMEIQTRKRKKLSVGGSQNLEGMVDAIGIGEEFTGLSHMGAGSTSMEVRAVSDMLRTILAGAEGAEMISDEGVELFNRQGAMIKEKVALIERLKTKRRGLIISGGIAGLFLKKLSTQARVISYSVTKMASGVSEDGADPVEFKGDIRKINKIFSARKKDLRDVNSDIDRLTAESEEMEFYLSSAANAIAYKFSNEIFEEISNVRGYFEEVLGVLSSLPDSGVLSEADEMRLSKLMSEPYGFVGKSSICSSIKNGTRIDTEKAVKWLSEDTLLSHNITLAVNNCASLQKYSGLKPLKDLSFRLSNEIAAVNTGLPEALKDGKEYHIFRRIFCDLSDRKINSALTKDEDAGMHMLKSVGAAALLTVITVLAGPIGPVPEEFISESDFKSQE